MDDADVDVFEEPQWFDETETVGLDDDFMPEEPLRTRYPFGRRSAASDAALIAEARRRERLRAAASFDRGQ